MRDLLRTALESGPVFDLLVAIIHSPVNAFGALVVAASAAVGVRTLLYRSGLRGPLRDLAAVGSAAAVLLLAVVLGVEPSDPPAAGAEPSPDTANLRRASDR